MPFNREKRSFWLEAGDGQCQYEMFVGDVLQQCGNSAKEVHHIMAASVRILAGLDPNETTGLPLCQQHHRGIGEVVSEFIGDPNGCFHPDMNQALLDYRHSDKDAFKDAAGQHRVLAELGERVTSGDWKIDEYYTNKMEGLASALLAKLAGFSK